MGNASGREEDAAVVDGDCADVEDGGGDSSVLSSEHGFPPYGSGGDNHVWRACSVGVVGGGSGAGSPPGSPSHSLSPRMFVPQMEFKTALGQLLDLITTHDGEKDLTKYNITVMTIPHRYGDPELIGKIRSDIEDYKCSWLVVQALQRADECQKRILFENYGKKDSACVAKVKNLYKGLNLEAVFQEYENESYKKLIADIEAQPSIAVQNVLKSFLHKIYKRQK